MKSYFEFLSEAVGNSYKNQKEWKEAAEHRGYKVSSPTVDEDGETNQDGHWTVAKDKQGNNKGSFDSHKKKGNLK